MKSKVNTCSFNYISQTFILTKIFFFSYSYQWTDCFHPRTMYSFLPQLLLNIFISRNWHHFIKSPIEIKHSSFKTIILHWAFFSPFFGGVRLRIFQHSSIFPFIIKSRWCFPFFFLETCHFLSYHNCWNPFSFLILTKMITINFLLLQINTKLNEYH